MEELVERLALSPRNDEARWTRSLIDLLVSPFNLWPRPVYGDEIGG